MHWPHFSSSFLLCFDFNLAIHTARPSFCWLDAMFSRVWYWRLAITIFFNLFSPYMTYKQSRVGNNKALWQLTIKQLLMKMQDPIDICPCLTKRNEKEHHLFPSIAEAHTVFPSLANHWVWIFMNPAYAQKQTLPSHTQVSSHPYQGTEFLIYQQSIKGALFIWKATAERS